MRIIRRVADNVVIFAAEFLELNNQGARGSNSLCKSITPQEYTLLKIGEPLPEDFIGEGYSFKDGKFKITQRGLDNREFLQSHQQVQQDVEQSRKRKQALLKRWPHPTDLVDEILDQLDSANIKLQAKTDLNKIKEENPL